MAKTPKGWKLSIRDNERHKLDWKTKNYNKLKRITPEEIKKDKQNIIERHRRLGLDENLKKELYPHLFN